MRRLPEVRGEEAKKSRRGRGRASARAGCGRGREGRTGTGTRARACGCRAAPAPPHRRRPPPPAARALPREPQDRASRPCVPSRRGRHRLPGPVLPGRVGREPPAPRGNHRLPARRGGATAATAFADRGRARASEGWGAARGAERPGSCHLRLRDLRPGHTHSSRCPKPGHGGEEDGKGRPPPQAMEARALGARRSETPKLRPRAAGSPRWRAEPSGPGLAAGTCRPLRPRRR